MCYLPQGEEIALLIMEYIFFQDNVGPVSVGDDKDFSAVNYLLMSKMLGEYAVSIVTLEGMQIRNRPAGVVKTEENEFRLSAPVFFWGHGIIFWKERNQ